MKKICVLLLMVLLLVGCSAEQEEGRPVVDVSRSDRERYTQLVDKKLYDAYWRYSRESLEFFQGSVPERNEENAVIFAASDDVGLSLAPHAGKSAVAATVDLIHYNGEAAGRAYFYFVGGNIIGAYYSGGYNDGYHSLKERNLFLADGGFLKFETGAVDDGVYKTTDVVFPADGFDSAIQQGQDRLLLAAIELGNVIIYQEGRTFSPYRTLYLNSGGIEATSAVLLSPQDDNALAVLLSNTVDNESPPIDEERIPITSVKVVFYNQRFQKNGEMTLNSPNYTCVASEGMNLLLFNGDSVEYYVFGENGFEKTAQYFLGHGVSAFHETDLDDDGTKEYLMTDERDLYLYHKTESGFVKIWSTHLGVESLNGSIYSGDLNQDGISEIYIGDTTGTMIRYTLTPSGLRSANRDVEYGDRIYPLNKHEDGFIDYVRLNNVEGLKSTLYRADSTGGE